MPACFASSLRLMPRRARSPRIRSPRARRKRARSLLLMRELYFRSGTYKLEDFMLRPPHRRSRAALQSIESSDSARTILFALVANIVIAIAKLVSGLISGSTALLAEAAHSLADASNEVFLGISLRRAAKPADNLHPLGHGRERFLWSFLAAIASFLIGGCFSIGIAIRQ